MAHEEDLYDARQLEGEGNTQMVCFHHKGKVILRFREQRLWVGFDPQKAAEIANELLTNAVELGVRVEIKIPKRKITEEQRAKLIVRVGHVIRSTQEQNRRPDIVAKAVVDTLLSAID